MHGCDPVVNAVCCMGPPLLEALHKVGAVTFSLQNGGLTAKLGDRYALDHCIHQPIREGC